MTTPGTKRAYAVPGKRGRMKTTLCVALGLSLIVAATQNAGDHWAVLLRRPSPSSRAGSRVRRERMR